MVSEGRGLRNERHDEPPRPPKCYLAGEGTGPVFGVIGGKGKGGHGLRLRQHLTHGSVAFNGVPLGRRINVSNCVGSHPIHPSALKGNSANFALRGFSQERISGASRKESPRRVVQAEGIPASPGSFSEHY